MAEFREIRTEWGEVRSEQTPFRSQGVELWGTVTIPLPKRAPRLPGAVIEPTGNQRIGQTRRAQHQHAVALGILPESGPPLGKICPALTAKHQGIDQDTEFMVDGRSQVAQPSLQVASIAFDDD